MFVRSRFAAALLGIPVAACSVAPEDSGSAAVDPGTQDVRFREEYFEDDAGPRPLAERVDVTAHLITRDGYQWTVRFTATNRGAEPVHWGAPGEMPIRVRARSWSEEDQSYGYRVRSFGPAPIYRLGTLEPGESRSWTVREPGARLRGGVGLLFHDAREGRDVIVWAEWQPILLGRAPGSARPRSAR